MIEATDDEKRVEPKFYLPSVVSKPNVSRIETAVTDLLSGHGVVLIPESYNE